MAQSAIRALPGSAGGRSFAHLGECRDQVLAQLVEWTLDAARPADQDMIRSVQPGAWQDLLGKHSKAAFHSVADDGAADLFRDGDSKPHGRIAVVAATNEEHEPRRRGSLAAIGCEIIGAAA